MSSNEQPLCESSLLCLKGSCISEKLSLWGHPWWTYLRGKVRQVAIQNSMWDRKVLFWHRKVWKNNAGFSVEQWTSSLLHRFVRSHGNMLIQSTCIWLVWRRPLSWHISCEALNEYRGSLVTTSVIQFLSECSNSCVHFLCFTSKPFKMGVILHHGYV